MSKLSSKVLVSWLNKLFTLNGLLGGKSQSDADHAKAADSSTDVSNSVEVEKVEAERVDPDAPLPLSEADEEMNAENSAEPEETPRPGLVKWIKMKIYYFFFPPPMLVPVQLKTPEVDMDAASEPLPLRGQLIYILIGAFFFIAVVWPRLPVSSGLKPKHKDWLSLTCRNGWLKRHLMRCVRKKRFLPAAGGHWKMNVRSFFSKLKPCGGLLMFRNPKKVWLVFI
jgi:hypothetical protein